MKKLTTLLLLAALAAAEEPGPADPTVELPEAPRTKAPADKPDHPVVVINITKDGEIRVVRGQLALGGRRLALEQTLETLTLDRLGTFLDRAKRFYDLARRSEGKHGLDDIGLGVKAASLFVDIRADRRAPWQWVECVMTILAEQKYYKVRLAARNGDGEVRLDSYLPTDQPILPDRPPRTEIVVDVAIEGGSEKTIYRFADRTQETLEGLDKVLDTSHEFALNSMRAATGPHDVVLIGKIRSSPRTPVGTVIDVLDRFRAKDYEHVHVCGFFIPPPEMRHLDKLPPPESNEVPYDVSGSAGIGEFMPEEEPVEPR